MSMDDGTTVTAAGLAGHLERQQARITTMIGKVNATWTEFHAAYAGLPDEELLLPGVTGDWSIRDLIAHLAWWDDEAITHLPTIIEGGTPPRYSTVYGGIDAFNAMKTEETRGLTLDEVRRNADETHQRLVTYLQGVPLERLEGNTRFTHRLRLDTYGHYPIHTADIHRWRERRTT